MPARTFSKQLTRAASRSGLVQFCFHLNTLFASNLDMTVPRHHDAVGGFFSATQERIVSTSFEGGNNSGVLTLTEPKPPRAPHAATWFSCSGTCL
jgi:hypothetical protein